MHTGYQRNEFDTSKFTLNYNSQKLNGFASKSQLDVFTGQNFGLDPDAPLFVNYPYGPGGLPLDQGMCRTHIIDGSILANFLFYLNDSIRVLLLNLY